MRRLVRRENASPGLDLSACVQHAQAEVDVCVAREPHGLDEGSSNESAMVTVCTVVGTVAVGCSRAGSTVVLGSLYFLSLFGPSGAATANASEILCWRLCASRVPVPRALHGHCTSLGH